MNNFKLTRNKMLGNIIEFESDGSVQEIMYDVSDKIADIIENLQKKAEQEDHYKQLYSEVKKQKDDVIKVLKALKYRILYEEDFRIDDYIDDDFIDVLLRMLGEIDDN